MLLTSGGVEGTASCLLIGIEGIGGEKDEGCTGIDNTSSRGQDRRSTIADALVDTPVLAGRAGAGDRHVGNITGGLARVGGAKVQFAGGIRLSGRDVVDTDDLG